MRIIETKVYTYDELSEPAKLRARGALYEDMCNLGIVTDDLRLVAAHKLSDLGWTGFDDIVNGEPEGTRDLIQFSIAFVQLDFVAWTGTKQFEFEGKTFTVQTAPANYGGSTSMAVVVEDNDDFPTFRAAQEIVYADARAVLSAMHDYDLKLTEDAEYLTSFAEANEIEFTEKGAIYR